MKRYFKVVLGITLASFLFSSCSVDYNRVEKDLKELGKAVGDKLEEEFGTPTTSEAEVTSNDTAESEIITSEEVTSEISQEETSESIESATELLEPEITVTESEEETKAEEIESEEETEETLAENEAVITTDEVSATESVSDEEPVEESTGKENEGEELISLPEITRTAEITSEESETVELPEVDVVSRVDFSEFTEAEFTTEVMIENEAFIEKCEADEQVYAEFSGNRSMISIEEAPNVAKAINLFIDGFYQEVAGRYARIQSDIEAQLALSPQDYADFTSLVISNQLTTNGRIISVNMEYKVEVNDEVTDFCREVYSFDLLTGQIINLGSISDNPEELAEALLDKFDEADGVTDFEIMFVEPTTDYVPVKLIGISSDGEDVSVLADLNEFNDLLNRFGRLVCLVV